MTGARLGRQVIGASLQSEQELPSGSSFGGLRGGSARLGSRGVALRGLSFVPGVTLSGLLPVRNGELQAAALRISGAAGAHGTVRLGSGKRVTGTLGGRRFDVSVATVRVSRTARERWGEWPPRPVHLPLRGPLDAPPAHLR